MLVWLEARVKVPRHDVLTWSDDKKEGGNVLREAWRAILDMLIKAREVLKKTAMS